MDIRMPFSVLALAVCIAANHAQIRPAHPCDQGLGTDGNVADASLIVMHADVPLYPSLAVAARQSGVVRLRISVRDGTVLSADTTSSASLILVNAAKENVRTWRFTPDVSGALEVTYIYELAKEESIVRENPRIEMQLPCVVRITARPVKPVPCDDR